MLLCQESQHNGGTRRPKTKRPRLAGRGRKGPTVNALTQRHSITPAPGRQPSVLTPTAATQAPPLTPFAQVPLCVWTDDRLSRTDLRLLGTLLYLARRMKRTGDLPPVTVRHSDLAEQLGIAARHVRTAIARLEAFGYVAVTHRKGRERPCTFDLNPTWDRAANALAEQVGTGEVGAQVTRPEAGQRGQKRTESVPLPDPVNRTEPVLLSRGKVGQNLSYIRAENRTELVLATAFNGETYRETAQPTAGRDGHGQDNGPGYARGPAEEEVASHGRAEAGLALAQSPPDPEERAPEAKPESPELAEARATAATARVTATAFAKAVAARPDLTPTDWLLLAEKFAGKYPGGAGLHRPGAMFGAWAAAEEAEAPAPSANPKRPLLPPKEAIEFRVRGEAAPDAMLAACYRLIETNLGKPAGRSPGHAARLGALFAEHGWVAVCEAWERFFHDPEWRKRGCPMDSFLEEKQVTRFLVNAAAYDAAEEAGAEAHYLRQDVAAAEAMTEAEVRANADRQRASAAKMPDAIGRIVRRRADRFEAAAMEALARRGASPEAPSEAAPLPAPADLDALPEPAPPDPAAVAAAEAERQAAVLAAVRHDAEHEEAQASAPGDLGRSHARRAERLLRQAETLEVVPAAGGVH